MKYGVISKGSGISVARNFQRAQSSIHRIVSIPINTLEDILWNYIYQLCLGFSCWHCGRCSSCFLFYKGDNLPSQLPGNSRSIKRLSWNTSMENHTISGCSYKGLLFYVESTQHSDQQLVWILATPESSELLLQFGLQPLRCYCCMSLCTGKLSP